MEASKLTAGLLARKGDAHPVNVAPARESMSLYVTPETRAASAQQVSESVGRATTGPGSTPSNNRVRLTLRLDRDRHRTLRLLSVHTGRSLQDIMLCALDIYVEDLAASAPMDSCRCLNGSKGNGGVA